jgi:glycosyltransferase involved in cell wall biosynthesis
LKVLQISQKNLHAPFDGGKIAMRAMAAGLRNAGLTVDQWVLDTPRQVLDKSENTAYPGSLFFGKLDTRIKPFAALKNFLFSGKSYNIERFESLELASDIANLIKKNGYTIVQAESIFALALIAPMLHEIEVPVVLRAHNVEHLIWERMAGSSSNPFVSFYLRVMSKRLKKDELNLLHRVDGLIAISKTDLELLRSLGYSKKAVVSGIPALRIVNAHEIPPTNADHIFHLGSMDWLPNLEGVQWFVDEVWPKLTQVFPSLKCSLAGKAMPDSIRNKVEGNLLVEQAPDAAEFMLSRGIMIVPLLSGGGIRAKIIEGLALGRVILTTSIGAEGIPIKNKEHLFVCNTADDFVATLAYLKQHPEAIEQVSKNACTFANENFSLHKITQPVLDLYNELTHP